MPRAASIFLKGRERLHRHVTNASPLTVDPSLQKWIYCKLLILHRLVNQTATTSGLKNIKIKVVEKPTSTIQHATVNQTPEPE